MDPIHEILEPLPCVWVEFDVRELCGLLLRGGSGKRLKSLSARLAASGVPDLEEIIPLAGEITVLWSLTEWKKPPRGGKVTQVDGSPFFYGRIAQNFTDPYFVARGLR